MGFANVNFLSILIAVHGTVPTRPRSIDILLRTIRASAQAWSSSRWTGTGCDKP